MLGSTDLTQPHEVENLRRSLAMLPANTGRGVLTREEALKLTEALMAAIEALPME